MNDISLVMEQLIKLTKVEEIEVRILKSKSADFVQTTAPKPLHSPRKNNLIDVGNPYLHNN